MSPGYAEFRRLARYGLVGLGSNLSLYLLFILFLRLGLAPTLSAGLCYVLGVALSYLLNRRWTFASNDSHFRDLPKFLLAYGIGLGYTVAMLLFLMLWLPPEIAQIINIGMTALVIYASLRVMRFGERNRSHGH